MTPRKRIKYAWLDDYPNLKISHNGMFKVRTPTYINPKRPLVSLEIKYDDKGKTGESAKKAIALYLQIQQAWEVQKGNMDTERLLSKIQTAIQPSLGDNITFGDYLEYYRVKCLPYAIKKNAKPLSNRTKKDYDGYIRQLIATQAPYLQRAIAHVELIDIRKLLIPWLKKNTRYNHLRSVLISIFRQAIDEGLRIDNPISEIEIRPTSGRDVYMEDDVFLNITNKMTLADAKVCDLLYLVGGRATNTIGLQEKNIVGSELHYIGEKTDQPIELEMNSDLIALFQWFRNWKAQQGIKSDYFVVYGLDSHVKTIGLPMSRAEFSRRFKEACIEAGYCHWEKKKSQQNDEIKEYKVADYQLRDIRPKSVTDENTIEKGANKGAHRSETGRRKYLRLPDPIRTKARVTVIANRE